MTEEHNYPPSTWRLIVHAEADGATNMAVDEAILNAVIEGTSPPTLRFYGWSPPCLSLGRSQPLADADLEACRRAGMDVVRRPTGGKAILHTDELTYAVALLQSDPRATGDVVESYRRLSEGLLAGLRPLGVDAVQARGREPRVAESARDKLPGAHSPGYNTSPNRIPSVLTAVCFETPSDYEILSGGRKLVGSAQWRARGGVLQHGTLPLCGDLTRIVDCLAFSDAERQEQRRAVRRRACTLQEALGHTISFFEAAQALAEGFGHALDLKLAPGELSPHECTGASAIRSRYVEETWTGRA